MTPSKTVLTLALVLAAPSAMATDVVPIEWSLAGTFEREVSVPAGKFAEVCGRLAAHTSVDWNFDADAPLDFNVHYHEGKKVHVPAKQDGAQAADGLLKVAASQDYCWMWTNKTARKASLKLSLRRK